MKKSQNKKSFFQPVKIFLPILLVIIGGLWLWENLSDFKDYLFQYVENGDILTLEQKYSAEQLMDEHRWELIGDKPRTFRDPVLYYYPYLLMDVKYMENKNSREGSMLWGLADGEVVLSTNTWETTHGFKDCLDCQATPADFLIINALVRHGGTSSIKNLEAELHIDNQSLERWVSKAASKQLIVQKGNSLHLHLEHPNMITTPPSRLQQALVFKPANHYQRIAKNYRKREIVQLAKNAFGSHFSVRNLKEVYLPVYRLEVENPDGSVLITEWNAITGHRQPSLGRL